MRGKKSLLFLITTFLLLVDRVVKSWTLASLLGETQPVFEGFFGVSFSLTAVFNQGAAWGMFSSFPMLLLVCRLALIIFLFYELVRLCKDDKVSFLRIFSLSLIAEGALSNVIDTSMYGYVVDTFLFTFGSYAFPVFNVADAMISCGVALFLLGALFQGKSSNA